MKLSPLTIYILGFAVFLILGFFGFFWQYQPNMAEADLWEQNATQMETAANQLEPAKKRVEQAKEIVNAKAAAWNQIVARRTPPQSVASRGINLAVHPWQLSVDTQKFRNNVQRAVNAQLRRGGVTVVSGPYVPGPDLNARAANLLRDYYNFPVYPFPVVIYNLGPVTVQGTYKQITNHVRAFRNMPNYLAVADGLQITGTSPNLTGTYNLSIVGFIKARQVFPAAQTAEAAGGGASGGPGGMPGMPGAGGPGGPPGGPAAMGAASGSMTVAP